MNPREVTRWALADGSDPPPWGSRYVVREEITETRDDGTVVRTITKIELAAAPGEGVSPSGSALQRNPDLVRRHDREQAFDEGVSFGRNSERLRILGRAERGA